MNFFKPTKLTFSIFILPVLFSITLLIGDKIIPSHNSVIFPPLFFFSIISIMWPFLILRITGLGVIFKTLNIDVGREITGGWINVFEPNVIGWIIVILANIILYYLIGCIISYLFRSEKIRSAIFYLIVSITFLYIGLIILGLLKSDTSESEYQPLTDSCAIECNVKRSDLYITCIEDESSFVPSGSAPEKYKQYEDGCDTKASDFNKLCNSQCTSE